MFKDPLSFDGRIRRKEYILSLLLFFPSLIIFGMLLRFLGLYLSDTMLNICALPFWWFLFSQGSKRCHDLGVSGWYQLIPFYIVWMIYKEGNLHENKYGVNLLSKN